MSSEFIVLDSAGASNGPYSIDELKTLAQAGVIGLSSRIALAGDTNFQLLEWHLELGTVLQIALRCASVTKSSPAPQGAPAPNVLTAPPTPRMLDFSPSDRNIFQPAPVFDRPADNERLVSLHVPPPPTMIEVPTITADELRNLQIRPKSEAPPEPSPLARLEGISWEAIAGIVALALVLTVVGYRYSIKSNTEITTDTASNGSGTDSANPNSAQDSAQSNTEFTPPQELVYGSWAEPTGDLWYFSPTGSVTWQSPATGKQFPGNWRVNGAEIQIQFDSGSSTVLRVVEMASDEGYVSTFTVESGGYPKLFSRYRIAPGFNCNVVLNSIEQKVCADNQIASMDQELARLYSRANGEKSAQMAWLRQRDNCSPNEAPASCIRPLYAQRISALCANLSGGCAFRFGESVSYKAAAAISPPAEINSDAAQGSDLPSPSRPEASLICRTLAESADRTEKTESQVYCRNAAGKWEVRRQTQSASVFADSLLGSWQDEDSICTYFSDYRLLCDINGKRFERRWSLNGNELEWFGGSKRYVYRINALDSTGLNTENILPESARGKQWYAQRVATPSGHY